MYEKLLKEKPLGNDLLSREVALQVPSALAGLTTGFGMEPGISPPLTTPENSLFEKRYSIGKSKPKKRILLRHFRRERFNVKDNLDSRESAGLNQSLLD